MSKTHKFADDFEHLTGDPPFPWQESLYREWFGCGKIPQVATLPTAMGKTRVIAIWLIALARGAKLPRRLVYVVNRRTIVDQTTTEIQIMRNRLVDPNRFAMDAQHVPHLNSLAAELCRQNALGNESPLGISTLRGQYADNQEWSADPCRPAVVCGTVDMIGSRLLFSGYRIGFRSRPLHAGFLGQDALLVHDESHLEPAFQELIESIQHEQAKQERTDSIPWPKLQVMALSATARHDNGMVTNTGRLSLTPEETEPPEKLPDPPERPVHHVWRRLKARKELRLHASDSENSLAAAMASLASQHHPGDAAIVVAVRKLDDVAQIVGLLADRNSENPVPPHHITTLTGTMRGRERDELVGSDPVFARFLPPSDRSESVSPVEGSVYLVCTSAGEVGINLSADHLICDLSTFESMVQRFGRLNRFGLRERSCLDVVYPATFEATDKLSAPRRATLKLLEQLHGDASPLALGKLDGEVCQAAYAPKPGIPQVTDILFDAWALTSLSDKIPGRPPVAPYLHGISEWDPPRTSVAWREEVAVISEELIDRHGDDFPRELMEDYPLKPHELLSDTSERVLLALQKLATKNGSQPVWLVDQQGGVAIRRLQEIADPTLTKKPDRQRLQRSLADAIVLLPPALGGLTTQGMLDGKVAWDAQRADRYDIADRWLDERGRPRRKRLFSNAPQPTGNHAGMSLVRTIDTEPNAEEELPQADSAEGSLEERIPGDGGRARFWHWFIQPRNAENATRASTAPIIWQAHTDDVTLRAKAIVEALQLPGDLREAVLLAAELHDLGKQRQLWQRAIGNPQPNQWYAKPGKPADGPRWRPRRLGDYRHEFGSLLDALDPHQAHRDRLDALSPNTRDVVLHLIAAHHGRGRPHFALGETVDPDSPMEAGVEAVEVMRRYGRLQRRYGRWGLAYLESLLRAADWSASAKPRDDGGENP